VERQGEGLKKTKPYGLFCAFSGGKKLNHRSLGEGPTRLEKENELANIRFPMQLGIQVNWTEQENSDVEYKRAEKGEGALNRGIKLFI